MQALAEVDNRYQLQYALSRQTDTLARTVRQSQRRQASAQKLFTYGDKTLDNVLDVKLKTLQSAAGVSRFKYPQLIKMFIRFETNRYNQKTQSNFGVFGAITELMEKGQIDQALKTNSQNILTWFSKNLLSPRPLRLKGDKYYGTCWFRETATEHIKQAQEICYILNKLGIETTIRTSEQFDEIIYSDKNQVVYRTQNIT